MALVWVTSLWAGGLPAVEHAAIRRVFQGAEDGKAPLLLAGYSVDDHGKIFDVRRLDVADGRGADFLDEGVDVALVVEVEVVVGGAGVFPDDLGVFVEFDEAVAVGVVVDVIVVGEEVAVGIQVSAVPVQHVGLLREGGEVVFVKSVVKVALPLVDDVAERVHEHGGSGVFGYERQAGLHGGGVVDDGPGWRAGVFEPHGAGELVFGVGEVFVEIGEVAVGVDGVDADVGSGGEVGRSPILRRR